MAIFGLKKQLFTWFLLVALFAAVVTGCGLLAQSTQQWWHTYFTESYTGKNTILPPLIAYINNSKRSIHIAAFEFDLSPVAEALIAAKKRGVEVQWVTDNEHGIGADTKPGHGQFSLLQKAGIPVKSDNRRDLMHNKFIVFDGKFVWTGSTNLTVNGTEKNNNNVLVLDSSEVAAIYEREFAQMWAGNFGPSRKSTVDKQKVSVNGTPVQVLFAPEDKVADKLAPVISNAKKSLLFMAFSFTHDGLGDAVLSRVKAGVDVRGIFETTGSETQYSELPRFYCAGVPVRQDGNPSAFHHKVFIVDNKTVVTGSFNFSNNADSGNDENVVVVENSDIAAEYVAEFTRRWGEARQPSKTKMKCDAKS